MKNERKSQKIFAAATACIVLAMSTGVVLANDLPYKLTDTDVPVSVYAGGKPIELTDKPFVKNGEVYVPVREFLNNASQGAEIIWNDDRTLIIKNSYNSEVLNKNVDAEVNFAIDSNLYKTKDSVKNVVLTSKLQNAPVLVDSKTYIPYELIRKINENLRTSDGIEITVGESSDYAEMLNKSTAWADGLKTRDGKPRYEMMTDAMQQDFIKAQTEYVNSDEWNYVIGYSSPWTISSDILIKDNNAYIWYYQSDSTPEMYVYNEIITFEKSDGKLLVSNSEEAEETDNSLCAYIRKIENNKITLDFAEIIQSTDSERIAELKLTDGDFPNGYYIYNPEETTAEYTLTDDTLYTFIDWNRAFTDENEDMFVFTNSIEDFKKYVDSYENSMPGMPFFFELDGDNVLSITEHYMP